MDKHEHANNNIYISIVSISSKYFLVIIVGHNYYNTKYIIRLFHTFVVWKIVSFKDSKNWHRYEWDIILTHCHFFFSWIKNNFIKCFRYIYPFFLFKFQWNGCIRIVILFPTRSACTTKSIIIRNRIGSMCAIFRVQC